MRQAHISVMTSNGYKAYLEYMVSEVCWYICPDSFVYPCILVVFAFQEIVDSYIYRVFCNYHNLSSTGVNKTDGPVTLRSLKKRPVFLIGYGPVTHTRIHVSRISFLTVFDWVKHILENCDWDLGHKVDLVRNVTLSRVLESGHRSNLLR